MMDTKPKERFSKSGLNVLLKSKCANTYEQLSPASRDNSFNESLYYKYEPTTPSTSGLSVSTDCQSPESPNNNTFEIDVRPRRRKFSTMEERTLFVEEYKRKYKTELCKNWEIRGTCKFGDKCCFAHGRQELKEKPSIHLKYKTKPCKQYHQTGYCAYGTRCQYLHKEALVPNIFFQPLEEKWNRNNYTYEMLHEINVLCGSDVKLDGLFKNIPERQRLSVFSFKCC